MSGKAVALYGEKYLRHMIPDILTCTQPPSFLASLRSSDVKKRKKSQ